MLEKTQAALAGAALYSNHDKTHDSAERWQRVSSRCCCPICDHATWCRISNDGLVAGCMRIDRGSFKTARTRAGDMYLHRLRADSVPSLPTSPAPARSEPRNRIAAASIDRRHAVYTAFLDSLTLSFDHAAYLTDTKRLSHETVTRNLYATAPAAETVLARCKAVAAEFDLALVPGFFRAGNRWRFDAREGELLIPCRDHHERIAAVVRRTGRSPKYVWASSARYDGVSSGAPLHFTRPYLAEITGEIIVTEGTLKADAIGERLHCAVVGIAGVASFGERFGSYLRSVLPAAKFVYVAFDSDERQNSHVRVALVRLLLSLHRGGYCPKVLQWDEGEGKGLDDVLLRCES